MPRIDPYQLLKILSVLLAPNGGIKSKEEVQRLASLMSKFSKKLVSKCIYVLILKASEPDLLVMWMLAGGWDLIYNWLSDGVQAENWPLVNELVDLLLICPVDIERLKSNRCPKLIKTLSKNLSAPESVQTAAAMIVKKWLDIVNDSIAKQNSSQGESADENENSANQELAIAGAGNSENDVGQDQLPVFRIIIRDGKEVLTEVLSKDRGRLSDNEFSPPDMSFKVGSKKVATEKGKQNLKVKKVMELNVPNKIAKTDKFDMSPESGTGEGSENQGEVKFVPRNKNDPTKDRRKDKLRQVRKDPDGDLIFEDEKPKLKDVQSSKLKKPEKKEETEKVKAKIVRTKAMKTKASGELEKQKSETSPKLRKLGKIPKKSDKKEVDKKSKEQSELKNKQESSGKKEKVNSEDKLKSRDVGDKDSTKSNASDKDSVKSSGSEKSVNSDSDSKSSSAVKKSLDIKKPPPLEIKRDSKKYNISVEARKTAPGESRPKTVKTYNSKFRSTGLMDELPPPPQPKAAKKNVVTPLAPPPSTFDKKLSLKRPSPPKEPQPPEKKVKTDVLDVKKPAAVEKEKEKPAAAPPAPVLVVKPPPVPKPKFIQESGSFMDALNASTITMKEYKKKKRRLSKEPETKKDGQTTPPSSPSHTDEKSPPVTKPNFRFYQDTLDHNDDSKNNGDGEKKSNKEKDRNSDEGDDNSECRSVTPTEEEKAIQEENIKHEEERQNSEGLRGVLIYAKLRKGPKKKVQWKPDLESIRHFELDETERVNVTKTFLDMKQMERIAERENFQMARKLANEDTMEERTRWRVLIPIDLPALPVIPGKNSNEKDIQYAREKTVPQAIYFNKRLIPDSPAEPDLEIHATTDPAVIPLEDLSGNDDSVNDFTTLPWPEPRLEPNQHEPPMMLPNMGPGPPQGPVPNYIPGVGPGPGPGLGPGPGPGPGPGFGPGPMGPMGPGNMGFPGYSGPPQPGPFGPPQPGPPNMGMIPPGDWRGSGPPDMKGPGGPGPDMFGPGPGMGPLPGMLGPPDMPFGMQGPPGPGPMGPGPSDDMNFPGGPPFNMNQGPNQGPPSLFNAPPYQGNNNFNQGNNNQNWNRGGGDRGGGNWRSGIKRDHGGRNDRGGGGTWRSGASGGGGNNWSGNSGKGGMICNAYSKWGNCRTMNCPYRHP